MLCNRYVSGRLGGGDLAYELARIHKQKEDVATNNQANH